MMPASATPTNLRVPDWLAHGIAYGIEAAAQTYFRKPAADRPGDRFFSVDRSFAFRKFEIAQRIIGQ